MGSLRPDGQVLPFPTARERLVTKRELADHFQVSEKTIDRWTAAGMPRLSPPGGRTVRFRLSECEAWWDGGGG